MRKDGSTTAYAFVSPGISGGTVDNKEISFRERCRGSFFKYDPVKAKKLFD